MEIKQKGEKMIKIKNLAIVIFVKKISMVPLIGGIVITLFGGLALYFDNKIFFI